VEEGRVGEELTSSFRTS